MWVWYRSLARARRMFFGRASPNISAKRSFLATRIPQEIVEMIITHLIYDRRSLTACSRTCYSWYIAAAPHLHRTLTAMISSSWRKTSLLWPKPLLYKYKLGLLPLVRKLEIRRGACIGFPVFSPKCLNLHLLPRFYALNNVQELEIDCLDIPSFKPRTWLYFGRLLPTVRCLALRLPKGSQREILYFVGLFQHLEDLKLLFSFGPRRCFPEEQTDDPMLIPPFFPPLRGRLTATFIKGVAVFKDMIDLFGGIRFRQLDLFNVDGMSFLLDACGETLETLRFHPNDPCGGKYFL